MAERIGNVDLVIALDSTCGNYDQLWITTSLRGMLIAELTVEVLEQGAHSGAAGGIVASSFRVLRQLLSRIEDESSGNILPPFLNATIPALRLEEARAAGQVLAADFPSMFTYAGTSQPLDTDPTRLVLNNTWRASLEVTGIGGVPSVADAGNTLRPTTTAKLALRLPPTVDAQIAKTALTRLLTEDPPHNSVVSLSFDEPAAGWHAQEPGDHLQQSVQRASQAFFNAPAISMGCGGSIPFMKYLSDSFENTGFVVTGVLGPHSNAHGPNEFLHIDTAKKLTACISRIIHDQAGIGI
jgi:acetylornithine deacetylase/succinyl-diaminopimelate desuccinylase-like protein